jgi:hypothetical protein
MSRCCAALSILIHQANEVNEISLIYGGRGVSTVTPYVEPCRCKIDILHGPSPVIPIAVQRLYCAINSKAYNLSLMQVASLRI